MPADPSGLNLSVFFLQAIPEIHHPILCSHLGMFPYNGRPLERGLSNHFEGN